MKRAVLIATLVAVLAAVFAIVVPATAEQRTSRVTLVLVPNLRWEDISPTSTPTLARLAREGATGDINARSRTRLEDVPGSPLEGALTISAGAWASPVEGAPAAYSVDESFEGGSAAEGYRRITGQGVGDAAIAFLGGPMTQRFNDELSFEVVLGTLGEAITEAGGVTAAVGNSDTGAEESIGPQLLRPAALAAMDTSGRVRFGDVSSRLLREDPNAPYGVATDVDAIKAALDEVYRRIGASAKPALVVVDPGDTYRAARIAPLVSASVAVGHRMRAIAAVDEVVSAAERSMPDDGVLIVASQVPGTDSTSIEGLGPVIVQGEGWSGYLTSPSTHRLGLVTNLDITATVLRVLGVDEPANVVGNRMASSATAEKPSARVAYLKRLTATAVAVDSAKVAIINGFIAVTTLILLVSTIVLLRVRLWPPRPARRWSTALRGLLLLVLATPPASWLMFVFDRWPSTSREAAVAFLVVVLSLWALALVLEWRSRLRVPVAALSLLCAGVMIVDQFFGAPLSFTSFLGYSPLLGARFYGMGNESAAALVGASLVGVAFLFDEWPKSPVIRGLRSWGLPAFGLLAVVAAAAPMLGANVGVAVWGVVGFALVWAQMNGHHVSWKLVLAGFVIMVLLVGAFSLIDLSGHAEQTHLGRAWASAERGGVDELWIIVARKARTNVRVLTHTNWAYLLIAVLAFLGFMRWRPQGDFAATLKENPHFAAAMSASLLTGLAAFFTEDSGIVIPAIIMLYVGVGILYLMLARVGDGPASQDASAGDGPDGEGAPRPEGALSGDAA